MIVSSRNLRLYWPLCFWLIFMLVQFGFKFGANGFRELREPEFWLLWGECFLGMALVAGLLLGLFFAYRQFCHWFDGRLESARSRIEDRIAARSGVVTWPTSDPLHDPEVDG